MNNILEVDLSKKLEIKINNQNPVGLQDLSLSLLSFNHQFHKFVESETNKETDIGTELLIKEVRSGSIIVEPVAKDNGSQMNINVSDGGKVINQFIINSNEAKAMQNQIGRLVDDMDTPEDNIHHRKVMYWYQTKFDPESETGNRAIIDDLTKSSLKVIFENNAVKEAMLHSEPKFGKPWHELAYVVDVEVQTVRGIPKLYKVLKYYPEYTFDPDAE